MAFPLPTNFPVAWSIDEGAALGKQGVFRRSSSRVAAALRLEYSFRRSRVFCQFRRGPDRARNENAGAIRAYAAELALGAAPAKRAFETADHRVVRLRRQILVAAFAIGSEC